MAASCIRAELPPPPCKRYSRGQARKLLLFPCITGGFHGHAGVVAHFLARECFDAPKQFSRHVNGVGVAPDTRLHSPARMRHDDAYRTCRPVLVEWLQVLDRRGFHGKNFYSGDTRNAPRNRHDNELRRLGAGDRVRNSAARRRTNVQGPCCRQVRQKPSTSI